MKKLKKSILVLAVMVAFLGLGLFLPGLIGAGDLEPSSPPGSTMHTLDEIYKKLDAIASDVFEIKTGCPAHWRFCDMGDGTVLDIDTGLIWLKDANCFVNMTWVDAMAAAASLADGQCDLTDGSIAGDWRLPTKEEWQAFVDTSYVDPALCNAAGTGRWSQGDAFNNVLSDLYWSSTTYEGDSTLAWLVFMTLGNVSYGIKAGTSNLWPVRGGN